MPVNIRFNPGQLEASIAQLGERAVTGLSNELRRTARDARDLARDYAPVKTGLLEKSIDYLTVKDGKTRRNKYVVYIDLDASRIGGEGELGDYAWIMELELHPYGRKRPGTKHRGFHLGPASRAKRASGKDVGGKFLERAVKKATAGLVERARRAASAALNNTAVSLTTTRSTRRDAGVDYRRETGGGDEE